MEAEGALNLPITDVLDRYLRSQRFAHFRIDRVTPGRPPEFGGEAALKFKRSLAAAEHERASELEDRLPRTERLRNGSSQCWSEAYTSSLAEKASADLRYLR
jgi:hypothetical protein